MSKIVWLSLALGLVVGLIVDFAHVPSPWGGFITGGICGAVAGLAAGRGWFNSRTS